MGDNDMSKIKCYDYVEGYPYLYAHGKRDGIWITVQLGRCITSHPTDVTEKIIHVPGIREALIGSQSHPVHGELFVPGEPASAVKHHMAKGSSDLRFEAFAVENLIYAADKLEEADMWCRKRYIPFVPYYTNPCGSPQDALDMFNGFEHSGGFEGVVFKDGIFSAWGKWKPVRTVDAVVTDYTEGEGKYLGYVGSLVVSVYADGSLVEIANVSGFDDATREQLGEGDLGKVIEVEFQYVAAKGRLRHPRFKRFRDDKRPEECTIDQLR